MFLSTLFPSSLLLNWFHCASCTLRVKCMMFFVIICGVTVPISTYTHKFRFYSLPLPSSSLRWKLVWLRAQEGLWRDLPRLLKHSAFPVSLPFVCLIECFLRFSSHIDVLSQSLDKLSKGDPKGSGRANVSVCVLLFPPPCTGMYTFSTRLVSIWLSLLHPVVSS